MMMMVMAMMIDFIIVSMTSSMAPMPQLHMMTNNNMLMMALDHQWPPMQIVASSTGKSWIPCGEKRLRGAWRETQSLSIFTFNKGNPSGNANATYKS